MVISPCLTFQSNSFFCLSLFNLLHFTSLLLLPLKSLLLLFFVNGGNRDEIHAIFCQKVSGYLLTFVAVKSEKSGAEQKS